MLRYLVLAAALAACHGNDPAKGAARSGAPATTPSAVKASPGDTAQATPGAGDARKPASAATDAAKPADPPPPGGHDFTPAGKQLLVVGACAEGSVPEGIAESMVAKHCEVIRAAQEAYLDKWVKPAHGFFAEKVPRDVPKKVVYPFAGGDLSTALTVFPDADEITTISLEPAGDPRTLAALAPPPAPAKPDAGGKIKGPRPNPKLDRALATIEYELKFLYRVNFSNTLNMIGAMRGGALPTQLIFGLSALKIHGYEVVSLRYFRLEPDGAIHYLDDDEVAKAPDPITAPARQRNLIFANAEVRFRKPGGRVQIYRHIQGNLGNDQPVDGLVPLKKDARVLKHLEAKGPVAGMTKAASYLLSWESFSLIREYLTGNVTWMVSDATGVAPRWGKPKGFEYETYGGFVGPHIPAGNGIAKDWRDEFAAQGKRELGFRFGYYDRQNVNHLIIMRKKT